MLGDIQIVNWRATGGEGVTDEALHRAIRYDGSAYAVDSQADTDALNPWATGGHCFAVQEFPGEDSQISIVAPNSGSLVTAIAGTAVAAGDAVRPMYSADEDLCDRYASTVAVPLAGSGLLYTTGRALTAAAVGGQFIMQLTVEAVEDGDS